MTTLYMGPGGNDGNNGQSWALRKLTLNGVEDIPVVAGDKVWVAPGVYRETLTCDVSGGNTYSTGTVDVTKGSTTVEGTGTAWAANVAADYMLHVRYYDQGNDMVTDGSNNVTAAGGNFQAAMEGMPIQINGHGAYIIDTVNAANDIDISDPNGLGWPGADTGVTYSVMSGEGHYEIESVTDNDTLVLKQPWQGRTLTGLDYLTFQPITYIADTTGEHTDGVGGPVRITGSDDDQSITRSYCIDTNTADYRVFRGFYCDLASSATVYVNGSDHVVLEDFVLQGAVMFVYYTSGICVTSRRIICFPTSSIAFYILPGSQLDDMGLVFESLTIISSFYSLRNVSGGGITVRNCAFSGYITLRTSASPTTGQCLWVTNTIFLGVSGTAIQAAVNGEIIENYNTLFDVSTARNNVAVGSSSITYPPLFVPPILFAGADQLSGFKFPWLFGELSQWSQIAKIAGTDERYTDLHGIPRPATASKNSWGPVQFTDMELESGTVQSGSYGRVLHDAGAQLVRRVPCTNVLTTVTLYVRRETNYAGSVPRMVIKQPGQTDRTTDMTAAVDNWEQLSDTFTPAATPGFFEVWVESRNTAAAGNYDVFYLPISVS